MAVGIIKLTQPLQTSDPSSTDANKGITTLRILKEDELLAHQIAHGQVAILQSNTTEEDEPTEEQQYITLSRKYRY